MKITSFLSTKGIILLCCIILISIVSGCKKKDKKKGFSSDSSVYSSQNYTSLTLDSQTVVAFLKLNPISNSVSKEVVEFYTKRSNQLGWFNQGGMTCAAPNFHNQLQNYSRDFADISLNNKELDSLMYNYEADEKEFMSKINQVERLDLLLTVTFFKYAQKVYGGTTKSAFDHEWFIPRKKKDYQMVLDSLVSSALCEKLQEPLNQQYIRLKDKLRQYRILQKKGGFPAVVTNKKLFVVGQSDSSLLNVKQHLFLSGDLQINDKTIVFTDSLKTAVQLFQRRLGLVESGKIEKQTLVELNKTIDFRIKQIMINMERLRWIPEKMESNYLLINIPEFRLHIFENEKQVWQTNVVVGKTVTKTSIFKGSLSQIILNPYWGVPTSIVKKEILPKLKRNPNYLENNNMEAFSGKNVIDPNSINWNKYENSVPFDFRQKPGKDNALGKMKFMFPNNYHIYLHDTPAKGLFGDNKRAFSHGCIRVENPKKLAIYLLKNQTVWNEQKIDEVLETDTQTGIKVNPFMPVYIAYFTAWVDANGQLNFRNDLYNLDSKLSKEVFGN
jgi:L,D-transpeptidase YcbB